jgi:hypothetical protein
MPCRIGPDDGTNDESTQGRDPTIATRYRRANKADKGRILDELCATTGWHRNHARKALAQARTPRIVKPRVPRPPKVQAESGCGTDILLGCAGDAGR